MNMKKTSLCILLSTLAFSSYAADAGAATNTPTTAPTVHAGQPANQQAQGQDPEILAVLVVLNKNEISSADAALQKAQHDSVKSYAKMMKKDHTKNLDKTLKLSEKLKESPVNGDVANTLTQKGQQEMAALSPLQGESFDVAYITAMVNDHTEALQLIDTNLLKNVQNPELKKHLKDTRVHIEHHLKEAKKIQTKLNKEKAKDSNNS